MDQVVGIHFNNFGASQSCMQHDMEKREVLQVGVYKPTCPKDPQRSLLQSGLPKTSASQVSF